jgi:thymidine kinase
MNKGKLELIIGPMFSGKSTEIIKKSRKLKVINLNYIIIKSCIDTRYEKDYVVSHDNEKENCIITDDLNSINDELIVDCNTIIIDEGQFLKNLKNKVLYWVEKLSKNVIIAGLDGDYKRNPIGEILNLIPYSDECIKLSALCKHCNDGTPGIFSFRTSNDSSQILVGSKDMYVAVCRKHYLELFS